MTLKTNALLSAAAFSLGATGLAADEIRPAELLVAYYGTSTSAETETAAMGRRAMPEATPKARAPLRPVEATLARQVAPCWNAPDQDSLPPVTLALSLDTDGTPEERSIHLADADSGDEAALIEAFTRARDAILNCGGEDGYTMARADGAEIELIFAMGGVLQ